MKLLFTLILILACSIITAQENYAYVDHKALQIPITQTYSTDSIAKYININFSTDKEKIRALYTWITSNVDYSKDSMFYFNTWGIDPEINMAAILRRRKGVCENYAALFANIISKCGVNAVAVTGYTNLPSNRYWNGHGWVAVQADKEWFLCDPTWDAGGNNYQYFLMPPDEFIQTHIPFDPLWQLLEHPVSHHDFQRGIFYTKKDSPVFNYKDSAAAYLQSDTLQQMQAAARRMEQSAYNNEDVKTWYSYNSMKVHIVLQEENMELFNGAVADLNSAKKLFNEFVVYRNNLFSPVKTDEDIKAMFANIEQLLADAYKKMNNVGKKSENYQYDTDGLKDNLDTFLLKVKAQDIFLKKYFASALSERQKLLFQ